ncbi:uncharacterized protein PV06_02675 [Exophiala oligosperma]|uniref:Nicotinamide N-methyltransferase n=1 Tax=Exophiala oligosperma TaxID=215243 RepID=A0A0D2DWR5_9EURO|nr:uncharacterized protein PV06_02675 [Exophiala oligosperma]KIW47065.1 hypothetical protein PV06_02675 [Exophiala oligosperma]
MYPSRVHAPISSTPSAEDFFSSALSNLFTDDPQTHHGVPGQSVYYDSPRFGRLSLRIPEHPDAEEGRRLFAYNLWNGGVVAADAIEVASANDDGGGGSHPQPQALDRATSREENDNWNPRYWSVKGKSTLELGAGAALPSIIAALSGAKSVTITDHPTSTALTMGAIEQNVHTNLRLPTSGVRPSTDTTNPQVPEDPAFRNTSTPQAPLENQDQTTQSDVSQRQTLPMKPKTESSVSVYGYTWGTTTFYLPNTYGIPVPDQPSSFQRIIIAECLWMHEQHVNICKTILDYLPRHDDGHDDPDPVGDSSSCALFVASFPNGREIVRRFFDIATGEEDIFSPAQAQSQNEVQANDDDVDDEHDEDDDDDDDEEVRSVKGKLKAVEIFEVDMNGVRRAWAPRRAGEDKYIANRWCVCAVLVRRGK